GVLVGGDDKHLPRVEEREEPLDGLPDHRRGAQDRERLLGLMFAGKGPEAGPAAPRHHNSVEVVHAADYNNPKSEFRSANTGRNRPSVVERYPPGGPQGDPSSRSPVFGLQSSVFSLRISNP